MVMCGRQITMVSKSLGMHLITSLGSRPFSMLLELHQVSWVICKTVKNTCSNQQGCAFTKVTMLTFITHP